MRMDVLAAKQVEAFPPAVLRRRAEAVRLGRADENGVLRVPPANTMPRDEMAGIERKMVSGRRVGR